MNQFQAVTAYGLLESPLTAQAVARASISKAVLFWGVTRISLGWIFLWAFLDKTFGLGFPTEPVAAWFQGASPTTPYLAFASRGPFASIFRKLAGSTVVEWLFMLGLLLIGVCLIVGIGVKIAGYSGAAMMALFYLSALWPRNNPFMNDFVIYIILLVAFAHNQAGHKLGLGGWWSRTRLVRACPFLE